MIPGFVAASKADPLPNELASEAQDTQAVLKQMYDSRKLRPGEIDHERDGGSYGSLHPPHKRERDSHELDFTAPNYSAIVADPTTTTHKPWVLSATRDFLVIAEPLKVGYIHLVVLSTTNNTIRGTAQLRPEHANLVDEMTKVAVEAAKPYVQPATADLFLGTRAGMLGPKERRWSGEEERIAFRTTWGNGAGGNVIFKLGFFLTPHEPHADKLALHVISTDFAYATTREAWNSVTSIQHFITPYDVISTAQSVRGDMALIRARKILQSEKPKCPISRKTFDTVPEARTYFMRHCVPSLHRDAERDDCPHVFI